MTDKKILDNIKKLREITGVGFSDCKLAISENNGDIEKSIEYLRKKGIAKASKKMSRVAAEGLVLLNEKNGNLSAIEINSETDFVAKNKDFISFNTIVELRLARKNELVKIMGRGELKAKLKISAHKFTASAKGTAVRRKP